MPENLPENVTNGIVSPASPKPSEQGNYEHTEVNSDFPDEALGQDTPSVDGEPATTEDGYQHNGNQTAPIAATAPTAAWNDKTAETPFVQRSADTAGVVPPSQTLLV